MKSKMVQKKKKIVSKVQKKKKIISKEKKEDPKDFDKQIEWGIDTLLNIIEEFSKKNKLIDNGSSIFLQVSVFKVPQVEEIVKRRIVLKHPPYAEKPEVCIIVHDVIRRDRVKRTDDEMIDHTVECYEDFFKKQKITDISTILPYRQLKCEYNTFELRRKLVNRFDVFLCSANLNNQDNFFKFLGKPFIVKNKFPISVKLPYLKTDYNPDVSKSVREAISSTVYRIKEGSTNITIKVGNTLNEKEKVKENLQVLIKKLVGPESNKLIPGGFENIRLMCLKTEKSKAVPIYISLDSGRKIPVPYVESNIPVRKSVEGELSTMMNKKVTVLPNGEIFVNPIEGGSDSENTDDEEEEDDDDDEEVDEDSQDKEEMDEEIDYQTKKKSKEVKRGKKRSREDVSDEEDIEEAIEAAEQKYLSNWNENLDNSEDEHSNEKNEDKKSKIIKKSVQKLKKNEVSSAKKLKNGNTKPKLDPIYGKLGKEKVKVKINKNQSKKKMGNEDSKLAKKKKMFEMKLANKSEKKKMKVKEIAKRGKKKM